MARQRSLPEVFSRIPGKRFALAVLAVGLLWVPALAAQTDQAPPAEDQKQEEEKAQAEEAAAQSRHLKLSAKAP